jgi:hypothetical protein
MRTRGDVQQPFQMEARKLILGMSADRCCESRERARFA